MSFSDCTDNEQKFVSLVDIYLGSELATLNRMILYGYSLGESVYTGVRINPSEVLRVTSKIRKYCDDLDNLVNELK